MDTGNNHDNILDPIQEALIVALDERDQLEDRIQTLEERVSKMEKDEQQ